jgi:hypothetical protein
MGRRKDMDMSEVHELPLFKWNPPECQVIAFPPVKCVGKVRDVAHKWMQQKTDKQADSYARRIEADMVRRYETLGIPEDRQRAMIAEFWKSVDREIARLRFVRSGNNAG